jgi:hypothetical protein
LAALILGAAGIVAYVVFPSPATAPLADRLGPGVAAPPAKASVLGQGQDSSFPSLPAPISIATAKVPVPAKRHKPTPHPPAPPAPPSTGSGSPFADAAGIGFYDGTFMPAGSEAAATWLGGSGTVKYAEDFLDATSFTNISDPWQLSNWQGSPFTMMWGVPMVPCGAPATQCATNVSDFNEVADGGADSYYVTLAKNLVNAGFADSYIRLGWEFNGTWMGWSVCNEDGSGTTSWASDFVPAFQNIVTSMRSVSGANFKFIWNPIDSSNVSCAGLEQFYPGDKYVDEVALDVYDGVGSSVSDSARWQDLLEGVNAGGWTGATPEAIDGQSFQGYGLNWLAAFGKAHDKEVGLPEFGLDSTSQNDGGGDDSYFITQIANWIKANGTGPSIFWNSGDGTLPLNIPNDTSGGTPNASAAFQAAFGS